MTRYRLMLFALTFILLLPNTQSFGQTMPKLQLSLIGPKPYQAPVGQVTELKMQILNQGPGDINLVRGEVYLESQLLHSESLGCFHLDYLQSAIWTFKLSMPSNIQVLNVSRGIPQVDLTIHLVYANAQNELISNEHFVLDAPGAKVKQTDMTWVIIVVAIIVLSITILTYWRRSSKKDTGHIQK